MAEIRKFNDGDQGRGGPRVMRNVTRTGQLAHDIEQAEKTKEGSMRGAGKAMDSIVASAIIAGMLLGATTAAAQSACNGGPPETRSITLMADWLPWASQAAFYEAKQKGFFTEEMLDVDIKSPPNPADPIKLVAMRRVQFSLTYVPEIMLAREMGIPILSVAIVLQKLASGLMVLPEKGVKTAADLKGMTLGVGPKADAQAFLRTMLAAAGLKREDVKIVDPGFSHIPMLMAGTVDAAHGLEFAELLVVNGRLRKENRPPATFLPYTDYGVPAFYYMLIAANEEWAKSNPQTTCRFLKASLKGLRSALANPEPINKFIGEARPGVYTYEENIERWNAMKPYWTGKDGKFFTQDLDTWVTAQKWALQTKLINEPVEAAEKYFTTAYLPE
jgi:putative hydroxymethylpyrimidine transport system substrate-binding protein